MATPRKPAQKKQSEVESIQKEETQTPPQIKSKPVTRDAGTPKVGKPKAAHKPVVSPGIGTTKVYSTSPTN
jgi:hypothetical protein